MRINQEYEILKNHVFKARKATALMGLVEKFRIGNQDILKNEFGDSRLRKIQRCLRRPKNETLKYAYDEICKDLDFKYMDARIPTSYERDFCKRIESISQIHFETSVWIGPFNVDIFFDSVCGYGDKKMRGLAVEIDGGVHFAEYKMRKDNYKNDILTKELGIGHTVVRNEHIYEPGRIDKLLREILQNRRLDFRAKQTVKRKIYLITLAYWGSNETLSHIYQADMTSLLTSN